MGKALLIRSSRQFCATIPSYIVLDSERVTIGRHGDVQMDTSRGKEISKVHAVITRRHHHNCDIWTIEDQHSVNGTIINRRKIGKTLLYHGDEVVFGGGAGYEVGDEVETDEVECRYVFFVPPPPVQFQRGIDLEKDITVHNDLICPICYETTIAPEELKCGHTFCLKCIHQWANTCVQTKQNCECPVCRKEFAKASLKVYDGRLSTNELLITTIEPFLRGANVTNIKKIEALTIFKKWKKKEEKKFKELFDKFTNNIKKRILFLHCIGATLKQVLEASDEDLQNAAVNLGCTETLEIREQLISEVLFLMMIKLVPPPKIPSYGYCLQVVRRL